MAEARVLVCDVCGAVEAATVTIRANGRNALKDLCPQHLGELMDGARRPKRGRRPGTGNSRTKANSVGTRAKRSTARRRRPRQPA